MRSKASSSFSRQNGSGIVPSAIKSAYTLPGTCAECHVWLSASRIRHAPPRSFVPPLISSSEGQFCVIIAWGSRAVNRGIGAAKKISLPIVREGIEELVRKEIIKARQHLLWHRPESHSRGYIARYMRTWSAGCHVGWVVVRTTTSSRRPPELVLRMAAKVYHSSPT